MSVMADVCAHAGGLRSSAVSSDSLPPSHPVTPGSASVVTPGLPSPGFSLLPGGGGQRGEGLMEQLEASAMAQEAEDRLAQLMMDDELSDARLGGLDGELLGDLGGEDTGLGKLGGLEGELTDEGRLEGEGGRLGMLEGRMGEWGEGRGLGGEGRLRLLRELGEGPRGLDTASKLEGERRLGSLEDVEQPESVSGVVRPSHMELSWVPEASFTAGDGLMRSNGDMVTSYEPTQDPEDSERLDPSRGVAR